MTHRPSKRCLKRATILGLLTFSLLGVLDSPLKISHLALAVSVFTATLVLCRSSVIRGKKECPSCNAALFEEEAVCPHCGFHLENQEFVEKGTTEHTIKPEPAKHKKPIALTGMPEYPRTCLNCGKFMPKDATVCDHCGHVEGRVA